MENDVKRDGGLTHISLYRLPKQEPNRLPKPKFFYSTKKYLNALNLNPTAAFNSMKTTLIKHTAPIYTVDNFKVKKLFWFLIFLNIIVYIFVHRFSSPPYLSIGFLS